MRDLFRQLKTVLVTGVLIVLPAWLAILLLIQLLVKAGVLVKPIAGHLPEGLNHPTLVGFVIFLLFCFLVGLLFYTTVGRTIGRLVDQSVLRKVPGYAALRGITDQLRDFEHEMGFKPSLVEIEDGALAPAFLVEDHGDGRCTVFVPSVPTPLAGGILILARSRVHPIDVPLTKMMQCISKWGSGSNELLAALEPVPPTTRDAA